MLLIHARIFLQRAKSCKNSRVRYATYMDLWTPQDTCNWRNEDTRKHTCMCTNWWRPHACDHTHTHWYRIIHTSVHMLPMHIFSTSPNSPAIRQALPYKHLLWIKLKTPGKSFLFYVWTCPTAFKWTSLKKCTNAVIDWKYVYYERPFRLFALPFMSRSWFKNHNLTQIFKKSWCILVTKIYCRGVGTNYYNCFNELR